MVQFPNISFLAKSMKSLNVAIIPVAFMSSGQGMDDSSPNLRGKVSIQVSKSMVSSLKMLGL